MTIHASIDQMWLDTATRLLKQPPTSSRDGDAREILGFVGQYPAERNWLWNKGRRASEAYAAAELLWYLSGSNDGRVMQHYAPQYARFLEDDGRTAYGAYGRRISDFDGLAYVCQLLSRDPNSRQAILGIWSRRDISTAARGASRDIPCTLSLQFLNRDGHLNLVTTMRSNDVWLGLPYDAWCFGEILKLVASALNTRAGWVQHQVGSMHLYERNAKKTAAALDNAEIGHTNPPREGPPSVQDWPHMSTLLQHAAQQEWKMRNGTFDKTLLSECEGMGSVGEWLAILAHRNGLERAGWLDERLCKSSGGGS